MNLTSHPKIRAPQFHPLMTARMAETAALIALGYANKQIAEEMRVSLKTVEKFRQQIHKRLGARCTADITRIAIKLKLIDLDLSTPIPEL